MHKAAPLATRTRELNNLSLEQAAKKARVSPAYLRQVEKKGGSYTLAKRLAAIYGCPIDVFLPKPGGGTPNNRGSRNPRTPKRQAPKESSRDNAN